MPIPTTLTIAIPPLCSSSSDSTAHSVNYFGVLVESVIWTVRAVFAAPGSFIWNAQRGRLASIFRMSNSDIELSDGDFQNTMELELATITASELGPFRPFRTTGGLLEKIVGSRDSRAREALI